MKKRWKKKLSPFFLCIMLAVAMAWFTTGCNSSTERENTPAASQKENDSADDISTVVGEGSTSFSFIVVDQEGKETVFEIHTDKETVGEALLELELIDGDQDSYGLYVETVNGITADYDKDGVYWAFYVNDKYAQAGVDSTAVTEGDRYSFKIEKA